jgi:hypothetical protein
VAAVVPVAVALVTGMALAGCGGADARAAASSGPVEPCGLMTAAQLHRLGATGGRSQPAGDSLGGTACAWTNLTTPRGSEYIGRVLTGAVPGGTPSASVNGLPTAEYAPPGVDPRVSCVYLVSVGPGQTLWAQFADPNHTIPGLNHLVACRNAQAAASAMATAFGPLTR